MAHTMTRRTAQGIDGEHWTTTGAHRLVRGDIVRLTGMADAVVVGRRDIPGEPSPSVVLTLEPTDGGDAVEVELRATVGALLRCDELFSA